MSLKNVILLHSGVSQLCILSGLCMQPTGVGCPGLAVLWLLCLPTGTDRWSPGLTTWKWPLTTRNPACKVLWAYGRKGKSKSSVGCCGQSSSFPRHTAGTDCQYQLQAMLFPNPSLLQLLLTAEQLSVVFAGERAHCSFNLRSIIFVTNGREFTPSPQGTHSHGLPLCDPPISQ